MSHVYSGFSNISKFSHLEYWKLIQQWCSSSYLILTLLWRRPISYRNQSIYDIGLRHERVKTERFAKTSSQYKKHFRISEEAPLDLYSIKLVVCNSSWKSTRLVFFNHFREYFHARNLGRKTGFKMTERVTA